MGGGGAFKHEVLLFKCTSPHALGRVVITSINHNFKVPMTQKCLLHDVKEYLKL